MSPLTAVLRRTVFLEAPRPGSCLHLSLCPTCGTSYEGWVSDFAKLGTLGTEGRSTSMTILSISIDHLRGQAELEKKARKFLCFSDNRQDASLQAGHFNDFVMVTLIRSALYNALRRCRGPGAHVRCPAAEGLRCPWGTVPQP